MVATPRPGGRRRHRLIILVKLRLVLVRLRSHKAVIAVEALAERPPAERPNWGDVLDRGEVPFAEGHGAIAEGSQDGRDHGRFFRDPGVVPRVGGGKLHYRPNTHRVMVAASQKGGPGG